MNITYNTLKSLVDQNLTQRQIAEKLNVSQSSVKRYLKLHQLSTNQNKIVKYCNQCQKILSGKQKKYCSSLCQKNYAYLQKIDEIEKLKDKPVGTGHYFIKKYLITVREHKCEICKNTEWNNQKIPLVLDHIDGNADNYKLENLRLICGNCDMQLPTYKGKNRGHGRFTRKQRYQSGQSY